MRERTHCWNELRAIVNKWDPIGVFDLDPHWPVDEYDCVTGSLLKMLAAGRPVDEITRYLEDMAGDHFGVQAGPWESERCAHQAYEWFWQKRLGLN